MTATSFIVLSFAATHGIPIAVAIRELFVLGRPGRPGGDEPPPPPLQELPKPLPDCLLPRTIVKVSVRELEDA